MASPCRCPRDRFSGFLGPNGAGKSTALGILAGLDRPTSGSARILGHDVTHKADQVHALTGFLPDVPSFYSWMNAREFLELAGRLFHLPDEVLAKRIEIVLGLAGLTGVDTPAGGYSRGMRQRLGIAQALINAPKVLLLDEPTNALDPIGRKDVLDIIAALAGRRTTVFFSSHILSDVERVCDQVAILDKGKVVLESSISTINARAQSQRLHVQLASAGEASRLA
jgi:ABC-2 type transport system ATP-binding protein